MVRLVGAFTIMVTDGTGCDVDLAGEEDCLVGVYPCDDWATQINIDAFTDPSEAVAVALDYDEGALRRLAGRDI